MKTSRFQVGLAICLVAFGVLLRLLPHPDNFAPLTALALFGGSVFSSKRFAIFLPLVTAIVSDAVIGFYGLTMLIVWISYAVIALVGSRWLKSPSLLRGATMTVASSIFFFITTNFAVWAFGSMYTHNLTGLQQCYTLALPFFRNSLLGDLIYTTTLFGSYAGIKALVAHSKLAETTL